MLAIIAGGKGTRLGLGDLPKPMAPVDGVPLLERQVILARDAGLEDIVFLLGHGARHIMAHFGDGSRLGVRIRHLVEDAPLGSGGCLKLLQPLVRDRFLVFNGDLLMDFDVRAFMRFDAANADAAASILVHPNDHPHDSDLVELDDTGRVRHLHLKPHPQDAVLPNLVNAGVFAFAPAVLDLIAPGESLVLEKVLYPRILARGMSIAGYRTPEYVKDVGTPQRLAEVTEDLRGGMVAARSLVRAQRAVFLDRDGVVVRFVDHLTRPEQLELLPGAAAAIRRINRSGRLAILVTNQPMIAKGFMTFDDLRRMHFTLETLLGCEGAYLDDIFFCPHHPETGFAGEVKELKVPCSCRKPAPGMLTAAADRYHVDLAASWMVGDQESDLEAGRGAGCRSLLVREGAGAASLAAAVERILAQD